VNSSALKDPNFRKKGRKRRPVSGGSELGAFLSVLRTEQGWTLLTAAQESGISHRVIAKLEKGRLDTSITNLEKYLNLYGFTLSAKKTDANPLDTRKSSVTLDDKGLPKWWRIKIPHVP